MTTTLATPATSSAHQAPKELPKKMRQEIDTWTAVFIQSDAFTKVPKAVTAEDAVAYVTVLAEKAYSQFDKTPRAWTKYAIKGVLTGTFVADMFIDKADYANIEPTLHAFLDFAAAQGYLNPKLVDRTQRAIAEAAPEMIALAQDDANYSPAKATVMRSLVREAATVPEPTPQPKAANQVNQPKSELTSGRVVALKAWKRRQRLHKKNKH
ncbi:MAG: hypothetical protein LKF36_02620 [Lactobacillus sp.]|jgi:hypothetical protein|nr:hypothetical protein [Lactobacillus sp.]